MTGHIRKRGEHSWELKFDLGTDPLTGRRRVRYASVKGTKADAKAELVRLLHTANTGTLLDPSKATLRDFLDRWARDWAGSNVSPKTAERWQQLAVHQVNPHLATCR